MPEIRSTGQRLSTVQRHPAPVGGGFIRRVPSCAEQTDRLEPAVRLLTDVADCFFVISVWGRRWKSGDRGRSMMSGGAGASYGDRDSWPR
jgi:hypothetical protein